MRIDNALAQVSKHKNLIVVVIGIAAIASYMIPFANLFAVADASGEIWKKSKWEWKVAEKKKKFDFKFADFFKKLAFKNLFIDKSQTTTNIFKNFGVKQFFNFQDINTATAYTGGLTTTPTSGSAVALNAGTTFIFVNNVLNCPSAAGSGSNSLSDTVSSTSCTQTNNIQIQSNPYVIFGGSV